MLTIKPEENYKPLLEEMNISIPDGAFVMAMKDGGELLGLAAARTFSDYAVIDEIAVKDEFKDFSLEYGLHIEKQLRALKFKSPDELKIEEEIPDFICDCKLCLDLDGYFLSNC